ncbi:hypothetical protein [Tsukamurella paurometabola]|uniref:hypothetical protein n=1 Tax=Tsukamurella paurometabola TaxID=2061 RepID=UPI00019ECB50|nr:hypothetical protein [Tsukamurella paurometabola]
MPIFRAALVDPHTQREQPSTTVETAKGKAADGLWAHGSPAARLAGGAFPRGASADPQSSAPTTQPRPRPPHERGYDAGR